MNKKIGIIAGVAAVIILGIVGFFMLQGSNKSQNSMESMTNKESAQNGAMFESLNDIFTNKSLSLQCDFTSENNQKATVYVKNGMIRTSSVGNTPEESGDVIIKDNTMYFWSTQGGIKMKFSMEDMESAQQNAQAKQSLADLEKYRNSCKTAVVNDSLFTPPANVTFQDMSSLMQAIPTGANGTGQAPTQEEIEALMKQYQQGQ